MSFPHRLLIALVPLAAALFSGAAQAGSCRARAIMESQCTWFVLDELGGDRKETKRAEREATADLLGGCSQGEYQMVLLRGAYVTATVTQVLRGEGRTDTRTVRRACAAATRASGF